MAEARASLLPLEVLSVEWLGCTSEIPSIGALWRPLLVLVHASLELLDSLLVGAEDHSFVLLCLLVMRILTFHFFTGELGCLHLLPGKRSNLVAKDLTLLGDLAILELFEQLLFPLTTPVAVHCVEELGIRADSSNIDA